jgi:molybdopterin converting factor small subunit
MKLRVLFFSILRDVTGCEELELTCDAPCDVASLLAMLFARWPKLAEWDASLLIAVDCAYVKRDAALHDGAEVAIMPPVQGG